MKYLFSALFALAALLLQVFLAPAVSFVGIQPDFIIIFLICAAPYCGMFSLPMFAAVLGAAFDLTTSGGIFINTAVYVIAALGLCGAKFFQIELDFVPSAVAVASGILLKGVISTVSLYILELTDKLSFIYFIKCMPSAVYTFLFMVPFFFLFKWIFNIKFVSKNDRTINERR